MMFDINDEKYIVFVESIFFIEPSRIIIIEKASTLKLMVLRTILLFFLIFSITLEAADDGVIGVTGDEGTIIMKHDVFKLE
jgi:hypothetical protein